MAAHPQCQRRPPAPSTGTKTTTERMSHLQGPPNHLALGRWRPAKTHSWASPIPSFRHPWYQVLPKYQIPRRRSLSVPQSRRAITLILLSQSTTVWAVQLTRRCTPDFRLPQASSSNNVASTFQSPGSRKRRTPLSTISSRKHTWQFYTTQVNATPSRYSPHQSDPIAGHIQQQPQWPQSQGPPGRPPSQAGPSHTPRSSQAQLPQPGLISATGAGIGQIMRGECSPSCKCHYHFYPLCIASIPSIDDNDTQQHIHNIDDGHQHYPRKW